MTCQSLAQGLWGFSMATYEGTKTDSLSWKVTKDEKRLDPRPSQMLWNHSPDGFSWGYGGSGPAQLALALLLDVGLDESLAVELHQPFKRDMIASLEIDEGWLLTTFEIEHWVRRQGHTVSTP